MTMTAAASSLSSPVLLLLLCCCWSFVSSGILPGPVRGYETYQHTFSSHQSQSYDSRAGAFQSYKVTSRQCSMIRRVTQYETVRVPFLCQAVTGRVAPLPSHMDSHSSQLLHAMQAGGWSICHQAITVPIYRYQRIPVCCPGTTPTPQGGCLCRKEEAMPTPGQLLQSKAHLFTDHQDSSYPGYSYLPATSTPIRVQPPRPYRDMLSKVSPGSLKASSLLHQLALSGQPGGGLSYGVDSNNNYNYYPRHPMAGGTEWQGDIARYLAAMMYQTLLVEQQQQMLQDEMGRQLRLRQQILFALQQQQQWRRQQQQQQKQQQQHQQQWQHSPWRGDLDEQPTFSSNPPPSPQPHPLPSPPTKQVEPPVISDEESSSTTVAPHDMDVGHTVPYGHQMGMRQEGEGPKWNGEGAGILDNMQDNSSSAAGSDNHPPMFGNGPSNIPPGVGGMAETKERVKGIIDSCLKSSGFPSMETILESRDVTQLRPICRSTGTVGPCVLRGAQEAFSQDQLGMMGRHMIRSVLLSLGHLCKTLNQMDTTSPPVFPNPPPPVTQSVITKVSGHIVTGNDSPPATDSTSNSNDNNNHHHHHHHHHQSEDMLVAQESPVMESNPPANKFQEDQPVEEIRTVGSDSPLDVPAVTSGPADGQAEAHVAKEKTTKDHHDDSLLTQTAAAAFPLWMILAMVGGCAVLLLFTCLLVCLLIRCRRRKKKSLELERQPEKLPVPTTAAEANIYAASPCHPPALYATTAVKQTLGGEEDEDKEEGGMEDEFKIPEDTAATDRIGKEEEEEEEEAVTEVEPSSQEKTLPGEEEEEEKKGKEEA